MSLVQRTDNVFDKSPGGTLKSKSRELGVGTNVGGTNAPKAAQLAAYKGAMWSGFAFGVFGRSMRSLLRVQRLTLSIR